MTRVGLGLRKAYVDALLTTERHVDFIEVIPENIVARGGINLKRARQAAERWPMLAHGVSMSFGGPDPLDHDYLAKLKTLLDELKVPFYTDHLCWSTAHGYATHDLLPLPFTEEAVRHTASRIREVSDALERPIAVENISFYAIMPTSTMSEPEFVRAVCEEADCHLLLDVNNVYVNADNHGRDGMEDLKQLPLSRVIQMHIAGHHRQGSRLVDTHGAYVCDEVLELGKAAVEVVGDVPILFEWDLYIPPFDEVADEADRLREAL